MISRARYYAYRVRKSTGSTGFLGIGVSLFYKNGQNRFTIGFEAPSTQKFLFPPKGGYSGVSTDIFETTIHHNLSNTIAIIGGLNYSIYHFHSYSDLPGIPDIKENDATFGLTIGAQFLMTKTSSFIYTYRPALYSASNKSYKQIISLGWAFNINFWNR